MMLKSKKMKKIFLLLGVFGLLGLSQNIYAADMTNEQEESIDETSNEEVISEQEESTGEIVNEEMRSEEMRYQSSVKDLEQGGYYITSALNNNMSLDVSAGSKNNGANIQLYSFNQTAAQKWIIEYTEDGYVRIINEGSGKVLDVRNGERGNGVAIQQYTWNTTNAQKWIPVRNADGTYTFYSALDRKLVLDVSGASTSNGARIQTYTYNGTRAQKFELYDLNINVSSGEKVIADGCYSIMSYKDGKVLDLKNASDSNGADMQLFQSNGTLAQCFYLQYESDGFYRICIAKTLKTVDLRAGGITAGTVVQQWANDSKIKNQKWKIVSNGDDSYRIVSAANGLSLDAGRGTSGTVITTQKKSDSKSQKWYFKEFQPTIEEGCYVLSSALDKNKVVDITNGSIEENANAQLYSLNRTMAQKWEVRTTGDGEITLQNIGSGLYLAVDDEENVCQRASGSQELEARWKLRVQYGKGYSLKNCKNGKMLDVTNASISNGTNISTIEENGSLAQTWNIVCIQPLEDGFYEFAPCTNTNLRMDVFAGSGANGANVQIYTSNKTLSQRWWVRSCGDGWYTLTACCSAKALDVTNASPYAGANVQQWQMNGSNAQKWKFKMGKKGIQVISRLGTVLDVQGGSNLSGANVQVWGSNGTAAQEWKVYCADKPSKIGWQNPSQYYQVSAESVKLPEYCTGFFTYVTPSRISIDASREACIETFIARAYEYIGTPYKWGYSCAPGVGVDCSGLVMQSLYAAGMETAFNPYIHPTQESTTSKMLNDPRFKKVSVNERRRGDLIFYPGHVGIYLGNNQIINARPVGVMVQSVWSWSIQGVVRPFV